MRTLNVRLAVILLVIIVVGGAGVYFIHYFQQRRNADFFLDQAEIAKQDVEKAKKEKNAEEEAKALERQEKNLGWYLSFRPNDLDVTECLGMLLAEHMVDSATHTVNNSAYRQAFNLLDKVIREEPDRNDARRKLIDLLILSRSFTDVMEHIQYLLKESPDNPELLQLLGQCQAATREYEKAQKSFEKAIDYSPKQIDTYPQLADLLRRILDKPKEAYDCMQNLVKNNPDSAKAYLYLGNYWESMDKEEAKRASGKDDINPREEAMNAAAKALELAPDDQDMLLLAARCSIALDKIDQARKYTEHNLEVHKDSPVIYSTLADIIAHSGKKENAIEVLNQGLKETKNSPQLLWHKAIFLIDLRNLDAVREVITQLQTAQYPKHLTDYLEARLAFAQKEWADAARRFEKVRPSLISIPQLLKQTDLSLGYCYGQLHSVDQQISAYQRVLKIDPFLTPARQGLTDAYQASGRIDEAVQEYAILIKTHNMPASALIPFASLLIRQNMGRSGKEQKWEQVEKVLDEAEKNLPDSEQIPLLCAEVLHAQNRNREAEKLLQKAHEKNPKQINFWNAMINIASLQKKWDQSEKILADFQKQIGDTVDVRLARCEYLLLRYDTKAGDYIAKLGENIDSFSDADRVRLWNGLLNAARRTGDMKLAKQFMDMLAQKDPNNLEVQFLRLEQAANNQDIVALEEALKDVKKVEGEGPLWLFGQARLLVVKALKENNPALFDEALQDLTQARDLRPSWSRIPLFMGTIYDQQNKSDQALKCYMEAIDTGEHGPAAARRTVQILFQKQRYADAEKLLRRLDTQQVPFTPELTRLWVQLMFQQGEFDAAVAKARQVVSEKSDDYKEHLWLGQMLGIAARRAKAQKHDKEFSDFSAEAEKSLRRAAELKGDAPETWVALVAFLSSVDKASAAEELIDKARGKIPAEKAPVALAQCYEAVEKNDLAMEQYKLALAANPNDPEVVRSVADFYQRIGKMVEAEALLRLIIDGKVKGDDANLFWARRQLAQITAAKGGSINIEAARNLIEQNLTATGNSADDWRMIATFDTIDPRKSRRDEAIDILRKMMEGKQATLDDRFNLAILYLASEKQSKGQSSAGSKTDAGDKDNSAWIKASSILRDLVVSQDSDPRYLAIYVNALLDHGDVYGAESYMNKLVKNFSNAAATIILQAQILVRHNQLDEALELMKTFVDMKNAIPTDRSKRIRMMAESMEQLTEQMKSPDQKTMAEHYIRTAEMFYRQYVDEHPSQSMDLVMFFIRQGQIDDAMAFLEQNWQNCEPISVAQVCMSIIQSGKKSKEIQQRVEKVLDDARVKFENHPGILLTLGDMRVFEERFSEGENFYRQILEKNPGHSIAMNNLAVLLALQGKKLDEALSLINKAIERSGSLASMLDTRACVYIAEGKANEALKDMEDAVADAPTPVRLFHQAQAFSLANQKYAASSTMQQALKAGLTKDMLQSPEFPAFEKLSNLAGELGTSTEVKKDTK